MREVCLTQEEAEKPKSKSRECSSKQGEHLNQLFDWKVMGSSPIILSKFFNQTTMTNQKLFTSKQEAELNALIRENVLDVLSDEDWIEGLDD